MQTLHRPLAFLLSSLFVAIAAAGRPASLAGHQKDQEESDTCKRPDLRGPLYKNKEYRFSIRLPKSWKGYAVRISKWEGGDGQSYGPNEELPPPTGVGPFIAIIDPHSTESEPRQDIPIMVFTYAQWDLVDSGKIILSAAPIGPGEIGRNRKFVFALPARYNYADLAGREEINDIFMCHAFHAY
jgi:hypothetical protein